MNAKELGTLLWNHPEPGFYEKETHRILSRAFTDLGFEVREFGDFPGFTALAGGSLKDKRIFLIADMDALPNPGIPGDGYIHSCGHHQQMVALFETARILKSENPEVLDRMAFTAIPAEEFIDFPLREKLRTAGTITHLSGKLELLHRGYFDDADFVVSTHSASGSEGLFINSVLKMSGFKVMTFTFTGRSSHAGAQPHRGINAQNAASLFLQAAAFLRESFDEEEHIRIHPILKLPPDQSVNLIPAHAVVETFVRSISPGGVNDTVDKLRNAALGCAQALGSRVEITVVPGYAPFEANGFLHELARKTCEETGVTFTEETFSAASSDVGDISQYKPTIMLGLPGNNGKFHNPGFAVTDDEGAYEFPGRFVAAYLKKLARSSSI